VGHRIVVVAHQVIVNCFRYLLEDLGEAQILAIDRQGDVPNCAMTDYRMTRTEGGPCFTLYRANFVSPIARSGAEVTSAPDAPTGPK
jgi:broad specificity phosphatase PhoE